MYVVTRSVSFEVALTLFVAEFARISTGDQSEIVEILANPATQIRNTQLPSAPARKKGDSIAGVSGSCLLRPQAAVRRFLF